MGIADEKYVSLITYRKNGDAVATPVWIAALPDGRVGFTTDATSGKVKRIRNNPAVTLTPCSMRGKIPDGAVAVAGTAVFAGGADAKPVADAIKAKYSVMVTLMRVGAALAKLVKRGSGEAGDSAVIITLDA